MVSFRLSLFLDLYGLTITYFAALAGGLRDDSFTSGSGLWSFFSELLGYLGMVALPWGSTPSACSSSSVNFLDFVAPSTTFSLTGECFLVQVARVTALRFSCCFLCGFSASLSRSVWAIFLDGEARSWSLSRYGLYDRSL